MAEQTLKEKTAKGLFWGGLSNGVQQVLNLVFGLILARILNASDYGMVGMLAIFSAIASTIQESGFTAALTNQKEIRHEDYNAVFWVSTLTGVLFYLILFFCAPLIAKFYDKPELISLSRVVFLGFLFGGFGISSNAYLFKNLKVKERAKIDIVSLLCSGTVGVTLALNGFAYYGLAIQTTTYIGVGSFLKLYFAPWKPTFRFDFRPLKDMFGFDVTNQDLALIGQFSENKFNGVNCGIMDQFAIAMGKAGHAIFLDTATLKYEYAPIKLENAKIVISCSNKKRGLGDSKYNERRSECETALAELQKVVKIDSLGELTEEQFEQYKDAIKDPVRVKRAKHAVYENQRTIKAVEALKNNDVALFGELMNASHVSLRDDYEVTGIELDTLVEEAWKVDGVIGSRMTGAGFGGCTVSIVKDEAVDSFIEKVGAAYKDKIGYAADFYVVEIGDGPVKLD